MGQRETQRVSNFRCELEGGLFSEAFRWLSLTFFDEGVGFWVAKLRAARRWYGCSSIPDRCRFQMTMELKQTSMLRKLPECLPPPGITRQSTNPRNPRFKQIICLRNKENPRESCN